MGCRYVLRIPGGSFVFRVPRFGEPPASKVDEDDIQAVTFFFTSEIRFRNPDAVCAALELHREATRIPLRLSGDQYDDQVLGELEREIEWALRSGSIVCEKSVTLTATSGDTSTVLLMDQQIGSSGEELVWSGSLTDLVVANTSIAET